MATTMDPQELVPLEAGLPKPLPRPPGGRNCHLAPRSCYTAPLRLCRLLALLIVLPSIFIFVPLYLRYRVFSGQMYPMSMTDMRLIDSKISPTWCQRQVVKSNATFNAFVVPGPPQLAEELVPVSMTRELELEDDMKEYWGFYLLKGSSVTVSACVRWPGASLIMIKGYKHLQECAYIGDDSSEEVDELVEAYAKGELSNATLQEKLQELKREEGRANDPDAMRRHRAGVSFHDPNSNRVSNTTSSSSESVPAIDVTDHDPKELREILERLHALREAVKNEQMKYFQLPPHLMSINTMHRHRNTNVDREERKWLSFEEIDGNDQSKEDIKKKQTLEEDIANNKKDFLQPTPVKTKQSNKNITRNTNLINNGTKAMIENKTRETNAIKTDEIKKADVLSKEKQTLKKLEDRTKAEKNEDKSKTNVVPEVKTIKDELKPTQTPAVADTSNLKEVDTKFANQVPYVEPNSKEVFEDVLQRLQALGDKGKRVLKRLHERMGVAYEEPSEKSSLPIMSAVRGSSEELDHLRNVLVEAIDEEKTRSQRQQKRRIAREEASAKRQMMLGQIELKRELNEDDEVRNYAAEEGLNQDEFAEDHMRINETTSIDMSNSEFWSSFSSSEEALLECEGLILNLPLTPHSNCHKDAPDDLTFSAAKVNALTYRVPANGYYFFVFNSENEVQRNYIRARFELQKTRYDVARAGIRRCTNTTTRCDLPLDIFSTQKVVLEVPLRNNDSLWNEQFLIISECEPRTSVYMVCVIAVPILIMLFAFQ